MHDSTHGEPLKECDLIEQGACIACERKLAQTRTLFFWRINMERHGLNLPAVKRQLGLSDALGSGQLAQAMGPDENMTQLISAPLTVMVCDECAAHPQIIMLLHGRGVDRRERAKLAFDEALAITLENDRKATAHIKPMPMKEEGL